MHRRIIIQVLIATLFGLSHACSYISSAQPYVTSTPQPTLAFPPNMPTAQSVTSLAARGPTFSDTKLSDVAGKVHFEDSLASKKLEVEVQTDSSNRPLERIKVQYVSDGNEFLIVALDSTGHFFPAVMTGPLSSLKTAIQGGPNLAGFSAPVAEAFPPLQGWETLEIILHLREVLGKFSTLQDVAAVLRDLPDVSAWTSSYSNFCLTGEQMSRGLSLLLSTSEKVLLPISATAVAAGPEGLLLPAMEAIVFQTAELDVKEYFINHPGPYGLRLYHFPVPFTFLAVEYSGECTLPAADIGPLAIWNGNFSELQNRCTPLVAGSECMIRAMQASGASPQAIDFMKLLEWDAFMSSFEEYGIVDLVGITYPLRANDNFQFLLANGKPQIVHVEDIGSINIEQDPNYALMIQKYPGLMIWVGDNSFIRMEQLSDGGQRFIFGYALVDSCHACQTEYSAVIAFDFDNTGQFLGTQLLYLE